MKARPTRLAGWPTKKTFRRSGPGGFSLLEILVGLGIIALLAVMIVPKMTSLIDQSRSVGCQSSLRQLHIAAISFAADHQGAIPYNYPGGWWLWKVDEYALPDSDPNFPMDLMCPASPKANGRQVARRFGPANYGMNVSLACTRNADGTAMLSYGDRPIPRLYRFTDLAAPASTVLYYDSGHFYQMQHNAQNPGGAWQYVPGYRANKKIPSFYAPDERITEDAHLGRHGGTVNFIHADGSMGQSLADDFVDQSKNWEAELRQ